MTETWTAHGVTYTRERLDDGTDQYSARRGEHVGYADEPYTAYKQLARVEHSKGMN